MAYPNPIKETGALSTSGDVFEYFKGGLLNSGNMSTNTEEWPIKPARTIPGSNPPIIVAEKLFLTGSPSTPALSFPCTRGDFYDYMDEFTITTSSSDEIANYSYNFFRTIHGTRLYAFNDVLGNINFPKEAVIHWGKIKVLEQALFGSIGNGGSLSTTSIVGSGSFTSRVGQMVQNNLNSLRYALARFDSYGSCHPDVIVGPELTYQGESTSLRNIRFYIPSGILVGDVEVSIDGGEIFNKMTGASLSGDLVTWPIPAGVYESYDIVIRVRKNRGAYIDEGPEIYNQLSYT